MFFVLFVVDKKPDLVTCRIGTESASGTASNSSSGRDGCKTENPTFIKFQPAKLSYTFEFQFSVDVPKPYPHHIKTSVFGITGAEIMITKTLVNRKFHRTMFTNVLNNFARPNLHLFMHTV